MMTNQNMPKLLFSLDGENGAIVCDHAPQEWKSLSIELNRDIDLAGVFVEFKADTLTFTGDTEKRYLRTLWNERGLLAKCSLTVSYLDMTTRTYIPFANDFILKFSSYSEPLISKSRNGVRLSTEVTGFIRKFRDRKGTKVDLSKRVTLGGWTIPLADHWVSLKKTLNIPQINVYSYANFGSTQLASINILIGAPDNFTVAANVLSSDFLEAVDVLVAQTITVDDTKALFKDSLAARALTVSGEIRLDASTIIGAGEYLNFFLVVLDTDGISVVSSSIIGSILVQGVAQLYSFTFSEVVNLVTEQSIIIYGNTNTVLEAFSFNYNRNSITIRETEITIPSEAVEAYPIYETIERNLQLILDEQYPLKSDFFGRLDVIKNAAGDFYISENQERFANVLNGLSLRGLVLSDINNSFAVSSNDIAKGINSLWNTGLGHEVIDGFDKIVIEDRAYFYSDIIGMDLSSRINDQEIQYEALPDLAYAKLETGYNSFDYEVINGRGEYNTKSEFTTIVPGDNTFDNVSPIRADGRGITLLLENKIFSSGGASEGTTDMKGDKDIFIIKTQKNIIAGKWLLKDWNVEGEENIQVLNNTSIFGATSFNLFFTPLRNLLRHGYEIASALIHDLTSYIRFQDSDKLQNLETTDGVTTLIENQDILVNDLDSPLWKPAQFIVKLPFYEQDIVDLIAVKHRLQVLSATKSGWILKGNYQIAKKELELYLLENANPIVYYFTSIWDTKNISAGSSNSDQISLPYDVAGVYSGTIDWGDGTTSINSYANRLHTYAVEGIYTVRISGGCNIFVFLGNIDKAKILFVTWWGIFTPAGYLGMFSGCVNLDLSEVRDVLNLSATTTLAAWFAGCTSLTTINRFTEWNFSSITSVSATWQGCINFNQPFAGLDFISMISMQQMLKNCTAFNQDISDLDISNCTNFTQLMNGKTAANYLAAYLDAIYNKWSLLSVQPNEAIDFGTIKYTAAGSAGKAILQGAPNNWTITDGGI